VVGAEHLLRGELDRLLLDNFETSRLDLRLHFFHLAGLDDVWLDHGVGALRADAATTTESQRGETLCGCDICLQRRCAYKCKDSKKRINKLRYGACWARGSSSPGKGTGALQRRR